MLFIFLIPNSFAGLNRTMLERLELSNGQMMRLQHKEVLHTRVQ